jgi:hypothetical protein
MLMALVLGFLFFDNYQSRSAIAQAHNQVVRAINDDRGPLNLFGITIYPEGVFDVVAFKSIDVSDCPRDYQQAVQKLIHRCEVFNAYFEGKSKFSRLIDWLIKPEGFSQETLKYLDQVMMSIADYNRVLERWEFDYLAPDSLESRTQETIWKISSVKTDVKR